MSSCEDRDHNWPYRLVLSGNNLLFGHLLISSIIPPSPIYEGNVVQVNAITDADAWGGSAIRTVLYMRTNHECLIPQSLDLDRHISD